MFFTNATWVCIGAPKPSPCSGTRHAASCTCRKRCKCRNGSEQESTIYTRAIPRVNRSAAWQSFQKWPRLSLKLDLLCMASPFFLFTPMTSSKCRPILPWYHAPFWCRGLIFESSGKYLRLTFVINWVLSFSLSVFKWTLNVILRI